MAYSNPILGAVLGNEQQKLQNKQFEANLSLDIEKLGSQKRGWDASAKALELSNRNTELKEAFAYYKSGVMDQETGNFPSPEQLVADPAWNQRVVDFYNTDLVKKVWDNDGTGKTFKGFVPVSGGQAVMELSDPNASPQERKFVTEKGTSDKNDNPMLLDEAGYARFNGKIVSQMENAAGMLGQFGRDAMQGIGNASRDQTAAVLEATNPLSRSTLNSAVQPQQPKQPQPQPQPQQQAAPADGVTEIPIDQSAVEVPAAYGSADGQQLSLMKPGGNKRKAKLANLATVYKLLRDPQKASELSGYTPEALAGINDTQLKDAAKFHKKAIEGFGRKDKRAGARTLESKPLSEDDQNQLALHTSALSEIKALAANRMQIGQAVDQNNMAAKAAKNAVTTQAASVNMVTDPTKQQVLDSAIKEEIGTDPKAIEAAATKAATKIADISPGKKLTKKDVYQLLTLKNTDTIDQATFNRFIDHGVLSSDTIDLVKNNINKQVELAKQAGMNRTKLQQERIKQAADENGDTFDRFTALDATANEDPAAYLTNMFASRNKGGLSNDESAHLSVHMGQKLNDEFNINWFTSPYDTMVQGDLDPQNAAIGMSSFALDGDRLIALDENGEPRGDRDVYLSEFSADEQKYFKSELKGVYETRVQNITSETARIQKKINEGFESVVDKQNSLARLIVLREQGKLVKQLQGN